MGSSILRLFDPSGNPVRGMRSYPTPSGLPRGFWSQLTNVYFDNSALKVRDGASKLTPSVPVANASFRGAWQGYLNGTAYIIAAYRVGSYTQVYSCNTTTFAWTELTGDGTGVNGAYAGNTRFPTDGDVVYAPSYNPQLGAEFLVVQNGVDYPRIYSPATTEPGALVTIHQLVTVPNAPNALQVLLNWPVQVTLFSPGTFGITATGYKYLWLEQGYYAAADSSVTVALKTGIGGAIPSALTWTSGPLNFASSKYVVFLCRSGNAAVGATPAIIGTPLMWNQVQVCMSSNPAVLAPNGTTCQSVWSPVHSQYAPVYIPDIDPTDPYKFAVAFPLSNVDVTQASITATKQFIFYLNDNIAGPITAPLSESDVTILAIYGDGSVPGTSVYGLSYAASGSGAESYGQLLTNLTTEVAILPVGSPYTGLSIPNSPLLYYNPAVDFQNTSAAQIQAGVDTVGIYRMDPGEFNYDLVAFYRTSTFTTGTPGSWSLTNADAKLTYNDTTPTSGKNPTVLWPDAYQLPIPIGSTMVSSNSRLYVGGVAGSGSAPNAVWISRFQNPFRFSKQVAFINASQPDLQSPTTVQFQGEVVQVVKKITGTLVGVDTVLCLTNTNGYLLEGSDVVSLSRPARVLDGVGCPYPRTVCTHIGTTYFVDNQNQVRSYKSGQAQRISRLKIDDKLNGYTLTESSMAVMLDRVYLSVRPPAIAQYTNQLVYDQPLNEWLEHSLASGDGKQILSMDCLTPAVIYAFSDAGLIYQLERPGALSDDGHGIVVTLTTPALSNGMWMAVYGESVGMVADWPGITTSYDPTFAVTRTVRDPAGSQINNCQIDLKSDTRSTKWVWEKAVDSNGNTIKPGAGGISIQVTLQGIMPATTNFYAIVMVFDPNPKQGDDAILSS